MNNWRDLKNWLISALRSAKGQTAVLYRKLLNWIKTAEPMTVVGESIKQILETYKQNPAQAILLMGTVGLTASIVPVCVPLALQGTFVPEIIQNYVRAYLLLFAASRIEMALSSNSSSGYGLNSGKFFTNP
ncbi:hypothetical protein [Methanofollis formosanus]|nr:hypothetical protein [Methanofollis formosanus]